MQEKMYLPENVEYLISRLNRRGYRADVVGGCVRDFLLGKEPNDYDITTDATPDEMRCVFSDLHTVETGIKHGTLTVILDSEPYEITTYRVDGKYSDNRHPDSVSFTRRISDDLSRRDFTVNAMSYNSKDGLCDLFCGKDDLENKVIRAVGDPTLRFTEDALRILRALRFASVLDFDIEEGTSKAIFERAHLLKNVSSERIYVEWHKLICGIGAYRILTKYSTVISVIIPELSSVKMCCEEEFLSSDLVIRELSLFALSLEELAPQGFYSAMSRLKSDNKHKLFGMTVLQNLHAPSDSEVALRIMLVKNGKDVTEGVIKLKILLGLSDRCEYNLLKDLLCRGVCYRVSDMKIDGNDLASIGLRGKEIGEVLTKLLYMIAEGKIENEREALLGQVASHL